MAGKLKPGAQLPPRALCLRCPIPCPRSLCSAGAKPTGRSRKGRKEECLCLLLTCSRPSPCRTQDSVQRGWGGRRRVGRGGQRRLLSPPSLLVTPSPCQVSSSARCWELAAEAPSSHGSRLREGWAEGSEAPAEGRGLQGHADVFQRARWHRFTSPVPPSSCSTDNCAWSTCHTVIVIVHHRPKPGGGKGHVKGPDSDYLRAGGTFGLCLAPQLCL